MGRGHRSRDLKEGQSLAGVRRKEEPSGTFQNRAQHVRRPCANLRKCMEVLVADGRAQCGQLEPKRRSGNSGVVTTATSRSSHPQWPRRTPGCHGGHALRPASKDGLWSRTALLFSFSAGNTVLYDVTEPGNQVPGPWLALWVRGSHRPAPAQGGGDQRPSATRSEQRVAGAGGGGEAGGDSAGNRQPWKALEYQSGLRSRACGQAGVPPKVTAAVTDGSSGAWSGHWSKISRKEK